MKKNKIKWYSYMAFILSSPYLLESCGSSVDSNNMMRNEENKTCNELYPKNKNELTQINEFSDSSLGSESSTKSIKEASDESNNLIENKEESSSEESDNGFQNSDPYANLSKAVNYKDFHKFIKNCKKRAEENKKKSENEDILEEFISQEGLLWESFSKEEFTKIQECINEILSNRQPDFSGCESDKKQEDTQEHTCDKKISDIIVRIFQLEKGDSLLLRQESYRKLCDFANTARKKLFFKDNKNLKNDYGIDDFFLISDSRLRSRNNRADETLRLDIRKNENSVKKFKIEECDITNEGDYVFEVTEIPSSLLKK